VTPSQYAKAIAAGTVIWLGAYICVGFYILSPIFGLEGTPNLAMQGKAWAMRAAAWTQMATPLLASGLIVSLLWRAMLERRTGRALGQVGLIGVATVIVQFGLIDGSHWFFYGTFSDRPTYTISHVIAYHILYLAVWMLGASVGLLAARPRRAVTQGDSGNSGHTP
jgi:hypothetical protein